jgi:hypothetical protein
MASRPLWPLLETEVKAQESQAAHPYVGNFRQKLLPHSLVSIQVTSIFEASNRSFSLPPYPN